MTVQPQMQLPYLNTREDSAFRFLGLPTVMRSTGETTNGAFGLLEHWAVPPGFASPYHTHHLEDEAFYVIEGHVAFVCDGKWLHAGPGTYVFGPRGIPHGFQIVGDAPARVLLLCSPAGFEHFVLEQATDIASPPAPPDMAKLMELAAKYQIDIHGPLPELPEGFATVVAPAGPKNLVLRWIEAFNERDWSAEAASRSSNFQAHLSGAKEPLNGDAWSGFLAGFAAAFPDSRISVDACIAEGDAVVARWTLTGTQMGAFQGVPPTGRAVKLAGIEFNRLAEGRIAEHWAQFDMVALLQLIGAM